MAGNNSKPAIPAWQRAAKQQPSTEQPNQEPKNEDASAAPPTENASLHEVEIPSPAEPVSGVAVEESTSKDITSSDQLDHMKTFLEDPAIKDQPIEKKRAFFESKGIPKEQIDEVLRSGQQIFNTSEFKSFERARPQPVQTRPPTQRPSGPPIITYPEFLVEAHKPPPLITPTRILNAAYIASGLYALVYGASKYLVKPMSESLSEARHEFAMHSQNKVEEFNERLSKLVSKLPETKKTAADSESDEDAESETSDPTELFHRDMGTQTSPPPSRRSSLSGVNGESERKKDALSYETKGLAIIQSHLQEILDGTEALETPNKERQDSLNNLRGYLDTLMYATPGLSMWNVDEATDKDRKEKDGDAIEELKKEIRGVKGVLLSAKRFPGVSGRVAGT